MQCACAILSCVWPVPLYSIFPHYLIKDTIFWTKKIIETKCVCVWVFLKFCSEMIFILRRTERDMMGNVYWRSCKVPLFFLSDFNGTWIFSTDFREKLSFPKKTPNIKLDGNQSSGSRVIPCGRTDRQTVITKLAVAFHNFVDTPTIFVRF